MNPIPIKLKKEMEADPYYKRCCLTGKTEVKIDWHHSFTYAGRQINEKWAIMPIWWKKHNWNGDKDSVHNCDKTKKQVELLSINRASEEDLKKYPKKDWAQIKNNLERNL